MITQKCYNLMVYNQSLCLSFEPELILFPKWLTYVVFAFRTHLFSLFVFLVILRAL